MCKSGRRQLSHKHKPDGQAHLQNAVATCILQRVRSHPQNLYWTCSLIVMGFVANRLNVSITGLQSSSGFYYVPKWTEFALTFATITAAVLAFRYAVLYLDILPKTAVRQRWISSSVAEA